MTRPPFRPSRPGGLSARSYQWTRDGEPVGDDSRMLDLNEVGADDAGAYQCEISDGLNTVTTESALLTVVPRLSIVTEPVGAERFEGEAYTFGIATEGRALGDLSYRWTRKRCRPWSQFGGSCIGESCRVRHRYLCL